MNQENKQDSTHVEFCKHCEESFTYSDEDSFWDDKGSGYSTKLVKCPFCGKLNIIKTQMYFG